MTSRLSGVAFACLALVVAGCSMQETVPPKRAAVLDRLEHESTADGRELVLIREYFDDVKLPEGEERWRVQYLWDYANGVAVQRIFGADGKVRTFEEKPALTLNATEEEVEFAFELVKGDPGIAPHLTSDAIYHGGFSFREPSVPACNMRSRCIHVFAVRDNGNVRLVHAIVDLMTARVVIRDYDHDLKPAADAASIKG